MSAENRDKKPNEPFAEFERRVVAAMIDVLAVFFLAFWLMSSVPNLATWTPTGRPVLAAVALLYFAGSWVSPLRATPVQWALRFHIVDAAGKRLDPGRALFRAVLFVIGVVGTLFLTNVPEKPGLLVIFIPSLAAFAIALVTINRQGLHDLLAGSVAVKSAWFSSPERRNELRQYMARNAGSPWRLSKPRPLRVILGSALVLLVTLAIYNAALVRYEMELRARISYAYAETVNLRRALEEAHRASERWETSDDVLGTPTRLDYPDGGYFELEEEGTIRIRFTVNPILRRISLVIAPQWDGNTLTWSCQAEGEIASSVLPAHCRS